MRTGLLAVRLITSHRTVGRLISNLLKFSTFDAKRSPTMSDLLGKSVIMTGASSGIGEGSAIFFATKGCHVTLCGRNEERLNKAVEKCRVAAREAGQNDNRFISVVGDITDKNVQKDTIEKTVEAFGAVDCLVANHGVVPDNDNTAAITEDVFDTSISTNVKSTLFLIKEAIPHLEKTRGCVVCVSSISSNMPYKGKMLSYTISKAALDHMVRALALDLGPHGIRINSINPTFVPTTLAQNLETLNEKAFQDATPLKGQPSTILEQAEVMAFLASNAARFVTGQSICVDGGLSCMGMPMNFV